MHIEIQVALNFVISYLYNKLPRRRVNIFGEELEKALKHKFQGHWYPDKPFKVSISIFIFSSFFMCIFFSILDSLFLFFLMGLSCHEYLCIYECIYESTAWYYSAGCGWKIPPILFIYICISVAVCSAVDIRIYFYIHVMK